ncbi:MAG TPA: FAD-dependent oxidoreductase [Anaerohalosphaeraceae bacterium]|jgi:NADPH-dependent 2,4-dienoyl-CoA reductase/sulfur reductase-like enzyme/rhodanese-related sulfurtransferase|nr:FAD-dependent oxidoreductase [Anaerohalosphaeraceae bacterium]
MAQKVIIVGGVAGGATAAARLRRLDEDAEIIVFERGPYISFANCGLPYYIGRTIKKREDLLLLTPELFHKRFRIDVRINQEVLRIDRSNKQVEIRNQHDGKQYTETYDRLILSPGAEPFRPPVDGIQSKRIFTLRSVPDMDAIESFIVQNKPSRAVIVGAGYIGLEMAENLRDRGLLATVVELAPSVLPAALDPEMAWYVQSHLEEKGVALWLDDAVSAFEDIGVGLIVKLKSGTTLRCDFAILSAGVKPEVKLAKEAGLAIGSRGGIEVNSFLQTSDPDIYAIGDAIEVQNPVIQQPALIPLAGPANKQGRMAADNICGLKRTYPGTVGTGILKIFDLTAAMTGVTETALQKAQVDYEKIYLHPAQHVGYYPGAKLMHIKALFDKKQGRILGAQIVGADGVDRRIDLLAAAIQKSMTVYDLMDLELAYAPPYGSGKDPINMVGFVGANVLDGTMPQAHVSQLREDDFILDVRTDAEIKRGSIPGAAHIPLDDLRARLAELPADKTIYPFCGVGVRSYAAVRILLQNGFQAKNINGGYLTWCAASGMSIKESENAKRLKEEFGII